MSMRLGDFIDDHCSRCHRLTDHSVVAMVGDDVKKVRCRTCQHEHEYRQRKGPQKKKTKLSAYEEVLASIMASKPVAGSPNPPEDKPQRRSFRPALRSRSLPKR